MTNQAVQAVSWSAKAASTQSQRREGRRRVGSFGGFMFLLFFLFTQQAGLGTEELDFALQLEPAGGVRDSHLNTEGPGVTGAWLLKNKRLNDFT